jgi:hypothetical protein
MKDAYGIPDGVPSACNDIRQPIAGVLALEGAALIDGHLCPPIPHWVLAVTTPVPTASWQLPCAGVMRVVTYMPANSFGPPGKYDDDEGIK